LYNVVVCDEKGDNTLNLNIDSERSLYE